MLCSLLTVSVICSSKINIPTGYVQLQIHSELCYPSNMRISAASLSWGHGVGHLGIQSSTLLPGVGPFRILYSTRHSTLFWHSCSPPALHAHLQQQGPRVSSPQLCCPPTPSSHTSGPLLPFSGGHLSQDTGWPLSIGQSQKQVQGRYTFHIWQCRRKNSLKFLYLILHIKINKNNVKTMKV